MGLEQVVQGREPSPGADGEMQIPLRRHLGARHHVVERRESPAFADIVPDEGVVAQVVVVVGDEDVEGDAAVELAAVGPYPAVDAEAAEPFGDLLVARPEGFGLVFTEQGERTRRMPTDEALSLRLRVEALDVNRPGN